MPGVTLITDLSRAFHPHADPRNVAMIKRRHAFWTSLARARGWDLIIEDAARLHPSSPAGVCGRVCWIDLPMLPRAAYRRAFTQAQTAGAASIDQHPDHVERVLGLDRFYPILTRAGVPTPRTAFVPVEDTLAAAILSPADVRRLLTEQIYGALFDAGIDPHQGVYVRGYYSSAKSANPEHYFGNNQADIEATTFEVIRRLRVSLELGGLALREHLELDRIDLPAAPGDRDDIRLPFEVRLTVLRGRAITASYHGPFEALTGEAQRALAGALSARSEQTKAAARALVPALLSADLPDSYVADVAFTRAGDAVVLELNPLYAAGYNVPAAHALVVTALGAALAEQAGYGSLPWTEVLETAAGLAGEQVEDSAGLWVLDDRD